LRTLVLDFEGTQRLCAVFLRCNAENSSQALAACAKVYASIAAGYAELDRREYDQAIAHFRQVRDPEITPKFFLHWVWRMTAQLGLSNVRLSCGNLDKAGIEADSFLESALSTEDPHVQALAWEMKTRVAIAEEAWEAAAGYLREGLSIVERFEVPVAAWQVHLTACDFYRHEKNEAAAERNRALAETYILAIANSFTSENPLRRSFLSAPPVRRVLDKVR